jgi:hypothetical protein
VCASVGLFGVLSFGFFTMTERFNNVATPTNITHPLLLARVL